MLKCFTKFVAWDGITRMQTLSGLLGSLTLAQKHPSVLTTTKQQLLVYVS